MIKDHIGSFMEGILTLQERYFKRDSLKLNYVEGSENGYTFLILPAYDNRWQSYSSIIPKLSSNTHLFGLDARGRGRSDRTPGDYNLYFSLDDTARFIEEIVRKPCHIFGHSSGGWTGLWLALEYPHLVQSLIVGDSSLDVKSLIKIGKSEEERESNRRLMGWAGKPYEELVSIFSERYKDKPMDFIEMRALTFSQVDPNIYLDWADGRLDLYFEGYEQEEVIRGIQCPTLVLQAEKGMISWEEALWARSVNNDIRVKQMTGMDHWLGIQNGRESAILSEIINFLFSL